MNSDQAVAQELAGRLIVDCFFPDAPGLSGGVGSVEHSV